MTLTPKQLLDFVTKKMRMSHIYQPLLIRSLLDSGGVATVRQLAIDMLAADESQIQFYESRIKTMPLPILRKHGIVDSSRDGLVRLDVSKMTFKERIELRSACETAIAEFLGSRGVSTWQHRLLETDPVPESTRYEVLKRDRRCVLCGATSREARLEVDHIQPRSKGGKNSMDNLQVLCGRCNRGKSNRDNADLR